MMRDANAWVPTRAATAQGRLNDAFWVRGRVEREGVADLSLVVVRIFHRDLGLASRKARMRWALGSLPMNLVLCLESFMSKSAKSERRGVRTGRVGAFRARR
jgi:hypothetical protein